MGLKRNIIKCKHCGDIIESVHRHDFKWCKCRSVAVDGGISYGKRLFPDFPMEDHIEDLSEYETKCIRCDLEIKSNEKALINSDGEIAHDNCIGINDLDENWME